MSLPSFIQITTWNIRVASKNVYLMVTKISVGKDKPILCCNVINEETQNRESYNANKIGPSESLVAHVTHMSRSTDMKSPKKGQVTVYSYFRLSKKAMLRT